MVSSNPPTDLGVTQMDVKEVEARVEAIRENRDDDESAHGQEDELHQDVLRAIAAGAPNAQELAKAALETTVINFSRWCA